MTQAAIAEAFRLLQAGDAAAALEASRRIIGATPSNARAHLAAGLALRLLGRTEESHAQIQQAAALDPDDYGAAYEQGVALRMQGRTDEAEACFARALQLRPEFAAAHYALGMIAFQRGAWMEAAQALASAARLDKRNPDPWLNLGLALAEGGQLQRAQDTLAHAVEMFPRLPEARHALGWVMHKAKRTVDAAAHLRAAVEARPDPRWRVDLGKALADLGSEDEARDQFESALSAAPEDPIALVTYGRFCVRRGDFERAATLFRSAWSLSPDDVELPMYLAQVELARGRWHEGWRAYARRDQRVRFEAECRARGQACSLPSWEELRGAHVFLIGEQGLGDELFFLRFAPALRDLGARLSYVGDARLRTPLERTGLFEQVLAQGAVLPAEALQILSGDLPAILESEELPASLVIAPRGESVEAMRRRLERAGPRPWIGVSWRAGTSREIVAHALYKSAPIQGLFAALPRKGTVVSLQREGRYEELESASRALGRPIHDFSAANADLEDMLALVSLLDRHIAVSNTNVHLAAAAGGAADVLVPFPPEWRWGLDGDSPWFPAFRVYRQAPGGDWSRAFAELANAAPGKTSHG